METVLQNKKTVQFAETPNPQVYRFSWGEKISDTSIEFLNSQSAQSSPLASKIFGFPWAQSVFIGLDFISIEKQDWVTWDILAAPLAGLIEEHLIRGEPILIDVKAEEVGSPESSDLIEKIKWVLNNEIRPAVAVDGGDVQFISFTNGYLKIAMKGACSGCPSSQVTLKEGIEKHLRELFPEILSVDSI